MTDAVENSNDPIAKDDTAANQQAEPIKSQVKFIRDTQENNALLDAQRDEALMQTKVAENRLDAVVNFAKAGVADPKDACLLLEQQLDLAEATTEQLENEVQRFLLEKPYLYVSVGQGASSMPTVTSSQRDSTPGPAVQLASVAQRAAKSGNRRDMAEYLRLRRQMAETSSFNNY